MNRCKWDFYCCDNSATHRIISGGTTIDLCEKHMNQLRDLASKSIVQVLAPDGTPSMHCRMCGKLEVVEVWKDNGEICGDCVDKIALISSKYVKHFSPIVNISEDELLTKASKVAKECWIELNKT